MSDAGTGSASAQDLGRRGASALGWGILASVLKVAATIGVQAALARLLGPDEFGLFAIGLLVVGVASYFSDVGLATSLVQSEKVSDDDVRFVFTMNLLVSTAVAAAVFAAAPWLAALFGKPEVAGLFRMMAPAFVLNALASVSVSLLRRSLDYRSIQLCGLAGYLVGYAVVGIGLAWAFGSAYALAGAFAAQSLVTLVLLYGRVRHPLGIALSAQQWRRHVGFAGTVLVTNLVNWAVTSMDRVVIGRVFSSFQLGLYSAAHNLVHAPVGLLYPNLQSVVFSTTARLQGQADKLRGVYLTLLQAVSVLAFPAFAGVYFLAAPLVLTIYGQRWEDASVFAAIFALMSPFLLVWAVSTPLLWNTGRRNQEFQVQLPFLVVAVAAIGLAAQHSLLAVGWVFAGLFALRTMIIVALVSRALDIGALDLVRTVRPAAIATAIVGTAAGAAEQALQTIQAPPSVRLLAGLAVIMLALLSTLMAWPGLLPTVLRRAISGWSVPRLSLARILQHRLGERSTA